MHASSLAVDLEADHGPMGLYPSLRLNTPMKHRVRLVGFEPEPEPEPEAGNLDPVRPEMPTNQGGCADAG